MANDFNISSIVTRETLEQFAYNSPFISTIRNENKRFNGVTGDISNYGYTVNVKKPKRLKYGSNGLNAELSVQDITKDQSPLSLTSYGKVHTAISTLDSKVKLDSWMEDIADPAILAMTTGKEAEHSQVISQVGQTVLADTGGADINDAGELQTILKENGTPMNQVKFLMPSGIMNNMVNNTSNFFNPSKEVTHSFYKGEIRKARGMDWMESELLPVHTNGTATDGVFANGVTPLGLVNDAGFVDGTAVLTLDDIGTDGTITAGTSIEIAGVYAVNNLTYQTTGRLKRFSVASTVTTVAGATAITLTENIHLAGSLQNVTALPANDAVVSYVGKVNTPYKQGIAYVRDTFMQAFVQLDKPEGPKFSMLQKNGVIARTLTTYESGTAGSTYADQNIMRCDSVSGVAAGRLEMGVRILQEIV
jgi:hypothetical protein